jgi:NADH-quinone oxidoreductase subunit G
MVANESSAYADVQLPAESHAEKEGTVTHPDGRLQRLRPGVPHPGEVRPLWHALAELAARLGHDTRLRSGADVLAAIAKAVPFYGGLTHEEIGGTGVRWQEREAAGELPKVRKRSRAVRARRPAAPEEAEGRIALGTRRDLWAAEATERNPALRFLVPGQTLELAPADAERLSLGERDRVEVSSNGASLVARVAIRARMRPGAAFLVEGTAADNANVLTGAEPVEVRRLPEATTSETSGADKRVALALATGPSTPGREAGSTPQPGPARNRSTGRAR